MSDMEKHVEAMIKKAADAADSGDAMRFAQAALNAANAVIGLTDLKKRNDKVT